MLQLRKGVWNTRSREETTPKVLLSSQSLSSPTESLWFTLDLNSHPLSLDFWLFFLLLIFPETYFFCPGSYSLVFSHGVSPNSCLSPSSRTPTKIFLPLRVSVCREHTHVSQLTLIVLVDKCPARETNKCSMTGPNKKNPLQVLVVQMLCLRDLYPTRKVLYNSRSLTGCDELASKCGYCFWFKILV